jgi:Protein of unknown function with PCYCGC motif
MVQPKQPPSKQAPRPQKSSTSSNVLFALAVLTVVAGGIFLFMQSGSSEPVVASNSATAAAEGAASPAPDAAPASDSTAAESQRQDTAVIPTAPPKKRPPAGAALPPINLQNYTPARPNDQVQAAHEWAAQYPDVSEYIPCFCGCERMGHVGNDDCFVKSRDAQGRVTAWEPHGVSCEVCLDVANESRRMYASGASVRQIRTAIEQKYRPLSQTMTPTPMPQSVNK